jgi:hypothetical protein
VTQALILGERSVELVSWGSRHRVPQAVYCEQQTLIASHFFLEAGSLRARCGQGQFHLRPLCLLPGFSHGLLSVCAWVLICSFYLGLGWGSDLNSGLCTCKAAALALEPLLQSILLWLFWRWGLMNYLLGMALNQDPPYLSLPSS